MASRIWRSYICLEQGKSFTEEGLFTPGHEGRVGVFSEKKEKAPVERTAYVKVQRL
jgi:hypothetical protein